MTIVNGVANGGAASSAANGSRIEEAHDGYFTSAVSVHHKVRGWDGVVMGGEAITRQSGMQQLFFRMMSRQHFCLGFRSSSKHRSLSRRR